MIKQLKSYFDQVEEIIFGEDYVSDFMNDGGVITVQESSEDYSVFDRKFAPISHEVIGDGCTYIVTKEVKDDEMKFTIYRCEHSDENDPDYDPANDNDCRNCPNFYLHEGHWYMCNLDGENMQDPFSEEPCRKRWC